jgi:uncharacterized protein YecT (DUF1311 family)
MKPAIALLLMLLLSSDSAAGQRKRKTLPCANAETQFEMTQCARWDFQTADALLNQVYQRLAAMLEDEKKTQLKEVQTAWLKYRDSNCEFVADEFKGGSMRPMIYAACLGDMTKKRTDELRNQIKARNL